MLIKEKYGLVTSHFYPIASEGVGVHPTYGTAVDLGGAVVANLAVNVASAQLYADDVAALDLSEFTSATLQSETTLSDLEVDSKLFGSAYSAEDGLESGADDAPNYGGFSFVQKLRTASGTIFRAVFLYKVLPILGDDNAQTKADSITFINNAVTYTVYADNTRAWRVKKDFADQASAEAWLAALAGSSAAYGITIQHVGDGASDPGPGTVYVDAGGSLVITFTTDPDALFDNAANVTASIASHKYTLTTLGADHDIVAVWNP